ncbi:hypothetical protein MN608_03531 [Microdochium nivale]|nr:hypothetical protein MN608_03531 [Microdochium nivale]
MAAKKSQTFATVRRDSTDSDVFESSLEPPSTSMATGVQAWSSRPTTLQHDVQTISEPQSCVTRSVVGEDCATQQFLVWAAIKRNRSVKMATSERLRCPLIRCGERFEAHELMLRHLSKCQHLRTGEYLCYECMQVERFNEGICGCSSRRPSKRRRIVKLAKNFFSNIGHKTRRDDSNTVDQDDIASPPPAYDNMLNISPTRPDNEQLRPQLELNGNGIIELDAEVVHQLDPVNYDQEQRHQTAITLQQAPGSSSPDSYLQRDSNNQVRIDPTPIHAQKRRPMAPNLAYYSPSGSRRPSLALNTEVDQYRRIECNKHLTPSSSVRSQQSSQHSTLGVSPITPWSASSRASGASADSWALTASGVTTHLTSPTTSPISTAGNNANMFSSYNTAKPRESVTCSKMPMNAHSESGLSKWPANDGRPDPMSYGIPEHVLFPSTQERETYSWLSGVSTELSLGTSVNVMSFSDTTSLPSEYAAYTVPAPATDAGRLLVESMWEALQHHVQSSFSKLLELTNNPLAIRLRNESPASIATIGFESLRSILNGKDPSDPLSYLCFVHVVYAFSLVLHEDELVERSEILFNQALAYRGFLAPSWFDCYSDVVSHIWSPEVFTGFQDNDVLSAGHRSSDRISIPQFRAAPATPPEKDVLFTVSQNFLDEFESLVLNSKSMRPADILSSALWSTHMEDLRAEHGSSQPFIAGATYLINVLLQSFRDNPGIAHRLRGVSQRVRNQDTSTVRRLEMELMQAGKGVLVKSHFFDKFVPQVRRHCSNLYSKHSGNPRARYHTLAASFAEQLLYDAAREAPTSLTQVTQPPALPVNIPGSIDDLFQFQTIDGVFDVGGGIDSFLQPLSGQGSPLYNFTSSAATVPLGITSSHLSATALRAASETTFSTDFVNPGVSAPDLITSSHSPSITSRTGSGNVRALISARKNPQKIRFRPREQKQAPAVDPEPKTSSGEQVAQPSGAPPATATTQIEANSCCEICGYRPKGDPQWFKGSMAKHKKLQHSAEPPTIYRCTFPGCTSAYKNRQDNLRQHQIEKNHFVNDDEEQQRRSNKRKRVT